MKLAVLAVVSLLGIPTSATAQVLPPLDPSPPSTPAPTFPLPLSSFRVHGPGAGGRAQHVSLLTVEDLDGDQVKDLAVGGGRRDVPGDPNAGVEIYSGASGTLIGLIPSPATGWGDFGYDLASGDVDGDGIEDIVVSAPDVFGLEQLTTPNQVEGTVYVYSTSGFSSFPQTAGVSIFPPTSLIVTLQPLVVGHASNPPATFGMYYGYRVATMDTDLDGFDEVIVSAPRFTQVAQPEQGMVEVRSPFPVGQSPNGLRSTLFGTLGSRFGEGLAVLDDVTGDLKDDLVVTGEQSANGPYLRVYSGQDIWLLADPTLISPMSPILWANGGFLPPGYGNTLPLIQTRTGSSDRPWTVCKVNLGVSKGSQFVIGFPRIIGGPNPGSGQVYQYLAATNSVAGLFSINEVSGATNFMGLACSGAGDRNGDGIQDVLIGGGWWSLGSPANQFTPRGKIVSGQAGQTLETLSPTTGECIGYDVVMLDDLNGDGRAEVALAQNYVPLPVGSVCSTVNTESRVWIY